MLRAREFIFLTFFIIHRIQGERKEGSAQVDDDNEEASYKRHVIEEGVKPAIFGSNKYDPINQVFETKEKQEQNNHNEDNEDRKSFDEQRLQAGPMMMGINISTSVPPTRFTTAKAMSGDNSWWALNKQAQV